MTLKKISTIIISVVLSFVLLFGFCQTFFAENKTLLFSEVETYNDSNVSVPIKLQDSIGLMGFKITFKCKNAEITNVTKSNVLNSGIFNSKISSDSTSCNVIWTDSKEHNLKGVLLNLDIKVKKFKKDCYVEYYSNKEDTINGKGEEVNLNCEQIILKYSKHNITQSTTSNDNTKYKNKKTEEFVLTYINNVKKDTYKKAINYALEKEDINNIKSLKKDRYKTFIKEFDNYIAKEKTNVNSVSGSFSPEKGISVIKEIGECLGQYDLNYEPHYDKNKSIVKESKPTETTRKSIVNNNNEKDLTIVYIAVAVLIILGLAIVLIIIIKRNRR